MEDNKSLLHQYLPGSTMRYGTYAGGELVWRVLAREGKKRLLLADRILANRPYHTAYVNTSWRECSLRRWLNQDFFQEAFSFQERTWILNTRVENPANPKYRTNGGAGTVDKIFLLSIGEAETYLPSQEERALDSWWWLRTPGCNLLTAVSVYADGSLYDGGINVHFPAGGVRPAMWVLLHE